MTPTRSGVTVFTSALSRSVPQLSAIFFFLLLTILITSCAIFYTEETWGDDPGDAFVDDNFPTYQAFHSIPGALWFSLVTVTAVGYGEFFPVTPSGRAVAAIVALLSQIIFALPITVIGSNYATAFREQARLRLIDQLQTSVLLKFNELTRESKVQTPFDLIRKHIWGHDAKVEMKRQVVYTLLHGRSSKRGKTNKDKQELWEHVVRVWDEFFPRCSAIGEEELRAVLDKVRVGEAKKLWVEGAPEAREGERGVSLVAPSSSSSLATELGSVRRFAGALEAQGAVSGAAASRQEAEHRKQLLDFCRHAATQLVQNAPEGVLRGEIVHG